MASIKTYTAIFVVLMGISTTQFLFEISGLLGDYYVPILAVIMILSSMKAIAVAGWYMHLIEEPRAVTYLAMGGLLCVVALTAGAAYSIV